MLNYAKEYRDLDLNFGVHPVTGDVVKRIGIDAITGSVMNILMTAHYEKKFNPEFGCGIRQYLFEMVDPIVANVIRQEIWNTITNYEPRVELDTVNVEDDPDKNGYNITLRFFIKNNPNPVNVRFFLERLR